MADPDPPYAIITDAELENLDIPRAEQLNARLVARWKAVTEHIQHIGPSKPWNEARRKHGALQTEWEDYSGRFKVARGANDVAACAKALVSGDELLRDVDSELLPFLVEADHPLGVQHSAEYMVGRMLQGLQKRQDEFEERTRAALEDIRGVKRDVLVTKAFGKHIASLKEGAVADAGRFTNRILVSFGLVVAAEFLIEVVFLKYQFRPQLIEVILLRLGVAAPFIFMAYFFFHQHKIARLIELKYRHLEGFLNGGGRELAATLAESEDGEKRLLKDFQAGLADSFLRIDEITSAIHKAETPLGDTVKLVQELRKLRE